MAITERLALIIDADGRGAVRELEKVGDTAERSLGRAESKAERWSTAMTATGTKMLATSAVLGTALWSAAQSTSDLAEAADYSGRVFGDASGQISSFAESAEDIGLSERAAHEATTTFGDLLKATGATKGELADMSVEMTRLATDMASAKNTSPEEAIEALGAALRGESEPIRRYGVMLDDATLKQRALDMGLVKTTTGTLPISIKMQAAYAEILDQTAGMQGNFADTADSAANKQRVMAAQVENAKAQLGEGFLPVMSSLVGVLGSAASGFAGMNEATGGAVSQMAAVSTVALGLGGAASVAAGKILDMRAALIANAAAGKTWAATTLAAIGPVSVAVAGLAGAFLVWEAAMARGERQVSQLGDSVRAGMQDMNFDEATRKFEAINGQIVELDSTIKSSRAPWDADYRADLSKAGYELMKINEPLGHQIGLTRHLADATGESEESIWRWLSAQEEAGSIFQTGAQALDAYRASIDGAGVAVGDLNAEQAESAKRMEEAKDRVAKLVNEMDRYFDELRSGTDLEVDWHESIDNLTSTLIVNGTAWDWNTGRLAYNTEAGRENWKALEQVATSAVDAGQAVRQAGGSAEEAAAATNQYVANLRGQLQMLGYNNQQIDVMLTELGLMPDQVSVGFTSPGLDDANREAERYLYTLFNIPRQITTQLVATTVGAGSFVGNAIAGRRAAGGPVSAGMTYLVGERGPELVTMPADGHVTDAAQTARMRSQPTDSRPQVIQLVLDRRVLSEVLLNDKRARTGYQGVGS